MSDDTGVNVLALKKCGEYYLFIFDDEHIVDLCKTFCRYALDAELSFDKADAMRMARELKSLTEKNNAEESPPEAMP